MTEEQKYTWENDGYLVIKKCIDMDAVNTLRNEIFNYLQMDPSNTSTWYDPSIRELSGIDERGMIPYYHSQEIWNVRQSPKIYEIFRELYEEDELLVSIDRLNMNPPRTENWNYEGFIHWDLQITDQQWPLLIQGLLCLSNTNSNEGGFQCVKGFQHKVDDWLEEHNYLQTRFPDTTNMNVESIPLEKGDFLIWNALLPHGNSQNKGIEPRVAMYISLFPKSWADDELLVNRRNSFLEGKTPKSFMGSTLPVQKGKHQYNIVLTQLGEKLLGL